MHGGAAESIILVAVLVKGLVNTVNASGVLDVVDGDIAVLVVLVVVIVVALSKGPVVAIMLPQRPRTVSRPISSPSIAPTCFWMVVAC